MDEAYQQLADEVARADGGLQLTPSALASRLGMPAAPNDGYAQYAIKRRLAAAGLTAEFRAEAGRVLRDLLRDVPALACPDVHLPDVSAFWGIGFGQSYADLQSFSLLHGNAFLVALEVVGLALCSYAVYYGWVLFVAGVLSSLFLAMWIKEKSEELGKLVS